MNGMLCIHGFTGSPREIEPLVSFLNNQTNWLIRTPVLPGHGDELKLKGVRYSDWIRHAEEELVKLMEQCDTIYICGFSMGGLIGSWLATQYPVKKMVLLSAAAYYMNPRNFLLEIQNMISECLTNSFRHSTIFQKYKRKFTSTPLKAYLEFRKLVNTIRPIFSKVNVPTLIVQGKMDPIVPLKSAYFLYESINTPEKKLLLLEEANHHICYCQEQQRVFQEIFTFLNEEDTCKKIAMTAN
ncbi:MULTISPECIES: alpha/beta hydrolase [Bacillaceae]|uniref:alpha/beta hydrolase n=1 Tax=Bacillaceae TaxID=186817 RepID=UPI001C1286BF|nr:MULTISPECIES: alpha/beta fold hydrolase [Bacillaceae]MBU5343194.1 alpha/beta fold hydrolase [Caldifermentibacillus hisashii]MCM3798886.1 alpha/beta fold hydrolase [Caldibacillus thermoamylovorans]